MLSDNEDIYCHNFGMIKKTKKIVIIIEIFHITGIVSAWSYENHFHIPARQLYGLRFRLSGLYAATRDDQWLDLDSKNKLRFIHKHVKSLDKYHVFFVNVIGG